MTIDERIEKMAERQEALTQSVELLAIEGRQTQAKVDQVARSIEVLRKSVLDLVGIVHNELHSARIEGQQ